MPIYEYQCPECSNIFEEWAKASEMQEIAPCPLCHTPSERIISHTAFVLKGGGWYVTDYGYRKNISEDSAAASHAGASPAIPVDGHSAATHGSQDGSAPSGSDAKQGQPAASEGATSVKDACTAPDKGASGGKSSTPSAPTGAAAPTSAV